LQSKNRETVIEDGLLDSRKADMLKIEDRRVWQGPDQILRMMNVRSKFVVADLGCVHAQTARPRQAKTRGSVGLIVWMT
jgi:hypothetical protein